jgi:hypothetical protein
LTLYKKSQKTINHRFPVYSKIDDVGNVIPKLVKCNNCEAVHYVEKICRSELRPGKDQSLAILELKDISMSLPIKVRNYLIENKCDISTFEHVKHIIEEKRWGENVVVKRDVMGEKQYVKFITLKSKDNFEVTSEIIEDIALNERH